MKMTTMMHDALADLALSLASQLPVWRQLDQHAEQGLVSDCQLPHASTFHHNLNQVHPHSLPYTHTSIASLTCMKPE